MPSPLTIVAAVAGLALLAAAGLGFLLKGAYERNGKLEASLKTATERLTELNNAHKERDKIDGATRALPDDKLFDGLRE